MKKLPDFHTQTFTTPAQREAAAALSLSKRQLMIENLNVEYDHFRKIRREFESFHIMVPNTAAANGNVANAAPANTQERDWLRELDYDYREEAGEPIIGELVGLLGEPGAGKSRLVETLMRKYHPIKTKFGYDFPWVYVRATDNFDIVKMAKGIFKGTGGDFIGSMSPTAAHSSSMMRLATHNSTALILDDSHFIFKATNRRRTDMLSLCKELVDDRICSVFFVGIKGVQAGMEANYQIFRRAGFPHVELGTEVDKDITDKKTTYLAILRQISNRLPFLEDCRLHSRFGEQFYKLSNGSIGLTMNVVKDAGRRAIRDGAARIELVHLQEAAFVRMKIGEITLSFTHEEAV